METLITASLTGICLYLLFRSVRHSPTVTDGRLVCAYSPVIRVALVICGMLFLGLVVWGIFSWQEEGIWALIAVVLFGWAGTYVLFEMFFVKLEFDSDAVYSFVPWRGAGHSLG